MNRKQEIETRLAQIRQEMEQDGADLDALTEEVRTLKAELDQIERTAEQRRQLREAVAGGAGTVVRSFAQEQQSEPFGIGSEEYRTAWLKRLQRKDLTDAEQRAYTAANGAISKLVVNDILSVVRDHAPLLQKIPAHASGLHQKGINILADPAAIVLSSGDQKPAVCPRLQSSHISVKSQQNLHRAEDFHRFKLSILVFHSQHPVLHSPYTSIQQEKYLPHRSILMDEQCSLFNFFQGKMFQKTFRRAAEHPS